MGTKMRRVDKREGTFADREGSEPERNKETRNARLTSLKNTEINLQINFKQQFQNNLIWHRLLKGI
jgi:hypothetical protein